MVEAARHRAAVTARAARSGSSGSVSPRPRVGSAVAARGAQRFHLVGVTWNNPTADIHGTVEVRTRAAATGRWSGWRQLETDGVTAADRRGASDPLWVGESDGVEARVAGARGSLPAGLRLDLINADAPAPPTSAGSEDVVEARPAGAGLPGRAEGVSKARPAPAGRSAGLEGVSEVESAPAGRSAGSAGVSGSAGTAELGPRLERASRARTAVPMPARPVPKMITRSGWGANEAIVRATPSFTGPVQVFFVHHTATGNGYRCADSPGIVRGIQAYQVRSRGWDDIGYNFLVDRCGRIFEGRGGGVGRSVLGAHTLGFNANASAIAVIGTYDGVGVSPTVRTAVATVAAYKLNGNAPNGRVVYTSGGGNRYPAGTKAVLYRISGHRDAGRTACPGDSLYRQLPAIRAIAGAAPSRLRLLRMSGAARHGSLLFTKGLIRPLWDVGTPSALINRFEVWVDGRLVVAAPGGHRTAPVRLSPGGHTVAVRALHLSGRSSTVTAKVVSDPNAPVFAGGPDVVLRPGSLNGTVPIRLVWHATDVNGLSAVGLVRPSTVDLGITARARNGTVKPAVPTTFTLRAADRAGNAVTASVTRTPMVVAEAAAERTGVWRTLRDPAYLGGVALGSTAAGSAATFTFTGRSAALAVGRGALSGRVRISVDGVDQGVVDLGSPRTVYRQAAWSYWWSVSGEHTVRVQVEGTAGRPGVVLDGLVYLK